MRRRTAQPAGGAEIEQPKKRVAPNGNKLPDPIREGEVLTDITKNQWRLGRSIGIGGFGEIYLGKYSLRTNTFLDEVSKYGQFFKLVVFRMEDWMDTLCIHGLRCVYSPNNI
jgi:hypothetical protein